MISIVALTEGGCYENVHPPTEKYVKLDLKCVYCTYSHTTPPCVLFLKTTQKAFDSNREKEETLASFQHLQHLEQQARQNRLRVAQQRLKELTDRESELQQIYAAKSAEYEALASAATAH